MINMEFLRQLALDVHDVHDNDNSDTIEQIGGVDFDMEEFLQKLNEIRELFSDD